MGRWRLALVLASFFLAGCSASNVIVLTDETFDERTAEPGSVWYIDIYAPWYDPCEYWHDVESKGTHSCMDAGLPATQWVFSLGHRYQAVLVVPALPFCASAPDG